MSNSTMDITCVLYELTLYFIRFYKWSELQLLKIFIKPISWTIQNAVETAGIQLHFTEDEISDKTEEKEEIRILAKCKKYDDLVHINVHDKQDYFLRMVNFGATGIGEGYLDGVWDFRHSEDDIIQVIKRMYDNRLDKLFFANPINNLAWWLELYAFNLQRMRTFQVGKEHYDLGNDLYELMLDPWMQYTCAYWAKASNLNEAQEHKLDLIAKKLDLTVTEGKNRPRLRVLDLGCGFGTLCQYLAENYDVEVVGVTISAEQAAYGREKCKGLNVEIRVQDYREVTGKFDRVVSIGMTEHVGRKNYREFFQIVQKVLKEDGLFLLHSIGVAGSHSYRTDPFIHRYIFPNSHLPTPMDLMKSSDGLFVLEDWHCFGLDYAKTLRAWRENFNDNWSKIEGKYGKRFYRLWIYYLTFCEAMFSGKTTLLWQVVFSRDGMRREYRAAR